MKRSNAIHKDKESNEPKVRVGRRDQALNTLQEPDTTGTPRDASRSTPTSPQTPDDRCRFYVLGDTWKERLTVTETHIGSGVRPPHYPEQYSFDVDGGAKFLGQLIDGAVKNPITTKMTLTVSPVEDGSSAVLQENQPEQYNVIRCTLDEPTRFSDGGKEHPKGTRFELKIPIRCTLTFLRADAPPGNHKTTDPSYRAHLLKRVWEIACARVTIDPPSSASVDIKMHDSKRTTQSFAICKPFRLSASRIEVSARHGTNVKINHDVIDAKTQLEGDGAVYTVGAQSSPSSDDSFLQRYYVELGRFDQIPQTGIRESQHRDVKVYRRRAVRGESRHDGASGTSDFSLPSPGAASSDSNSKHVLVCISEDGLGFADAYECKHITDALPGRAHYWLLRTGRYTDFRKPFYTSLVESQSAYAIAITSADSLRAGSSGGAAISDDTETDPSNDGIQLTNDVSWELVIEDLIEAIDTGRFRERKGMPRNLLIVFGLAGCAYVHFLDDNRSTAEIAFLFDPSCTEHEYSNTEQNGDVGGILSAFAAQMAYWIEKKLADTPPTGQVRPTIRQLVASSEGFDDLMVACGDGLRACRRLYDYGYGTSRETIEKWANGDLPTLQIFHENEQHSGDRFARVTFSVPSDMRSRGEWSILERRLRAHRPARKSMPVTRDNLDSLQRGALDLAQQIARSGLKALTKGVDAFPILKVGKLTTVDRGEIEGLRTVQEIFRGYLAGSNRRPASVAVFGAPGSGKSFGIRQVLENLSGQGPDGKIPVRTFNLTQFTTTDHLGEALLEVSNLSVRGELPAVFFDEFDVRDQQGNFRWVDRFLSVMEDGEVVLGGKKVQFGRAILVFAGGTYRSFSEFADPPTDLAQANRRAQMKVPDFVSRLTGYLNVAGPNPRSTDEIEKVQAWIRRAVQIRGHIEDKANRFARILNDSGGGSLELDVDDRVLDALLRVHEYRHGSRSLRSVLDLCQPRDDRKLSVSAFPVWSLLEMHVSADFRELAMGR